MQPPSGRVPPTHAPAPAPPQRRAPAALFGTQSDPSTAARRGPGVRDTSSHPMLLRHLGRFPRLSACWRGIVGIHSLSSILEPSLRALPPPASAETRPPQEASTPSPRGPALRAATGVPSRSLASVTDGLGGVCHSVSVRAGTRPAHAAPWQGGGHVSQAGSTSTVRLPQSCPLR